MQPSARGYDLFLPLAVVAVVGMMVFPLPTVVLDCLLTSNLAFGLALLISAVYLTESSSFTSLPAVLLLSTLLRLGLNISTTRQILSEGSAPKIIETFGNFVVGGNLVVGAVIFIIITIVQFLVIAKGAERIAEVAARFTLDAMPGKQMSIDADVRAGIIGLEEAREKRGELHRESRLFGALDGAMKFVKGDAIAGLLITIINISAGLLIGVTQQGLGLAEALQRYTLFTIGDGLVSQIPALLVAVAAGVAVTRVEDKDGSYVGREMLAQLSREPQALATTGSVLLILAFVPGLPLAPFMAAGVLLTLIAHKISAGRVRESAAKSHAQFKPKVFSAFVLRMGCEAASTLQREGAILSAVQRMRSEIFEATGVIVPDIQYDLDSSVPAGAINLVFNGVTLKMVSSNPTITKQVLRDAARPFLVETEDTLSSSLMQALRDVCVGRLEELIDDTHTRILFEVHSPIAEDLINSTVPDVVGVTELTRLLRQLVREGVSIRELRSILQAVAESNSKSNCTKQDYCQLLADVRQSLSRAISVNICSDDWNLDAWMLDAAVDQHFSEASSTGAGIDPRILDEVSSAIEQKRVTVLITSRDSRLICAELCRVSSQSLAVIAINELASEVKLNILGHLRSSLIEKEYNESDFVETEAA